MIDACDLRAEDLFFAYRPDRPVLSGLRLDVIPGSFLGIVGPNGAGKSTLLHLLSGALRPDRGRVLLDGRPLSAWRRRDAARRIAVVPQSEPSSFSWRVRDMVMMGRTPWIDGVWTAESLGDQRAVDRALEAVGIAHLADRGLDEISGGERQMVLVARALAQEPSVLLLDEPTASLDLAHRQRVMRLISGLNAEEGLTVIAVTHDLNLAALYCGRIAVLAEGRIAAEGTPVEIMQSDLLAEVYGAGLWSGTSPDGAPIVGLTR